MINTMKLSVKQLDLVKEIMAYWNAKEVGEKITQEMKDRWAKGLLRRMELREAHEKLRNRVANPYFITKNTAAKAAKKDGEHLYNLQRFIDFAAKHPPAAEEAPAPKAKKEAKGKKEAKPAKGKKAPVAEPVAELPAPEAN